MSQNKSSLITTIYAIFVEEPDDYYFHPRGVLFIDQQSKYMLFSSDVDYNFLMKIVRKFPYENLEKGVEYRGYQIELKNLTERMIAKYGNDPKMIPQVLSELYQTSPRQYSFLKKSLEVDSIL